MTIPTQTIADTHWDITTIPYARGLSEEHVKKCMSMFAELAAVNEEIFFVFWDCAFVDDVKSEKWKHSLDDLVANSQGFAPMTGQHSTVAIQRLHEMYPINPLYKELKFRVLMCDGSQTSRSMIESWGLRSNFKASSSMKASFKDTVLAMHRSYVALIDYCSVNEMPVQQSDTTDIVRRFGEFGGMTPEYARQVWSIAKRTGKVWQKLELIVTGKVKPINRKAQKKVSSPHHFNTMARLPDDIIDGFLDKVVNGIWTMRTFHSSCTIYKLKVKIRHMILTFLIDLNEFGESVTFADVTEKYPKINDQLVERWTSSLANSKDKKNMPRGLKDYIRDVIDQHKRNARVISFVCGFDFRC
jgi:hypothetical protein